MNEIQSVCRVLSEESDVPAARVDSHWISGKPPEGIKVAWLRTVTPHEDGDFVRTVLGVMDENEDMWGRWGVAGDWKGADWPEELDGYITHWQPYIIPDVELSHNPVDTDWIPGKPPEDEEVAWLRVLDGDQVTSVLAIFIWGDSCWCEAGDWKAESYRDPVGGIITHWRAYIVPGVESLPDAGVEDNKFPA